MSNDKIKKPTHNVYVTKAGADDKTFWSRIGGAWEHKDGNGLFIRLDTLPIDGQIVIRKARPTTELAGAA
jgi:hypothetical protein